MKKKLCFVLLLLLNAPTAFGQAGSYFEYPAYTAKGFGGPNVLVSEPTPEAACNEIVSQVTAVLSNNPEVRVQGGSVEKNLPGRWVCNWQQVSVFNGHAQEAGRDIFGRCQDPNKVTPRPEPLFNEQSPSNHILRDQCLCSTPYVFNGSTQWCTGFIPDKDKCDGSGPNYSSNPCNIATGNKLRVETDIDNGALSFTRYYNSQGVNLNTGLGLQWTHTFQRNLIIDTTHNQIVFESASGRSEEFDLINGNWVPDDDSDYELSLESGVGYVLTLPNGARESYGTINGQIISHTDTNGQKVTYDYNRFGTGFDYLESVTNHYGHQIVFEYELDPITAAFLIYRINKVTDAFGAVYQYQYDENRNLTTVIYPDTTPSDDTDNPRKIYHYENQDYPNHLTGITDENGERYGNFVYDDDGKAILSELGTTTNSVGQEKIELDFQ